MGTDQHELQQTGKMLYPEVAQFAEVIAIYHRGPDIIFEIRPKISQEIWFRAVKHRFLEHGFYLHFYQQDDSYVLVAKDVRPQKSKVPWMNIVLAVLTIFSMIFTYGFIEYGRVGDAFFGDVDAMLRPIWFMLALMFILACHEFGHYFAAKYHKADVSLPYFIPAPTLFGTLGAFIKSRSPFKNRIELFDVGVAGPLAGFVPALVILAIGMMTVSFEPVSAVESKEAFIALGDSLLLITLGKLFLPVPPEGYQIVMSPLLFAGWIGLFVTMMNLIPMGQLDGGHIIYALVGKKWHRVIAGSFLGILAVLGIVWTGWLVWAALIVIVLKVRHPATLDDSVPLDGNRRKIGWLAIAIFVLTFMPLPLKSVSL